MAYENYIQVTGVIQEISSGSSCCTLQIVLRTDQDMVNFIVNGDTQIIDNIRLRRNTECSCGIIHQQFCIFRRAPLSLPIAGNHICSHSKIQLQRLIFRHQIFLKVLQHYILIPPQNCDQLCLISWRKYGWRR